MAAALPPGWPAPPAHLHFLGICGYSVSGLALLCRGLGYRVTGSDEDAYPPTTLILTEAGVDFADRHRAENLGRWGEPALVVLGNQVQRSNPELVAAQELALLLISEAEAYGALTGTRRRAVICGSHGKTTTSTLAALMLDRAGFGAGFRLGATALDFGQSARLGDPADGSPFVFEGDEYTTSALDPRAKFLHWRPQVVTLLNLELDHPDLYPDLQAYSAPYRELVRGLPEDGLLLYNRTDPKALELARESRAPVLAFGARDGDWRLRGRPSLRGGRMRLRVRGPEGEELEMDLASCGAHQASNALAALATAVGLGADPAAAARAAQDFHGAARRFQVLGQARGVTVVDDYAHHPTKLRATIAQAKQQFGSEVQLAMVHVPHTYSRTRALLPRYRGAFSGLDLLVLGPIEPARERDLAGTVSSADLAALARGVETVLVGSAEEAIGAVIRRLRPPAVVVCSSVRGFDLVAGRLLAALQEWDA